jgi:hypothetical protein
VIPCGAVDGCQRACDDGCSDALDLSEEELQDITTAEAAEDSASANSMLKPSEVTLLSELLASTSEIAKQLNETPEGREEPPEEQLDAELDLAHALPGVDDMQEMLQMLAVDLPASSHRAAATTTGAFTI